MSETPETGIEESDPNADSADGLAGGPEGGMGVSSERRGPVRGVDDEVTYAASPTHPDGDGGGTAGNGGVPPEQSARDGEPEVHPDNDVASQPFDPSRNPGHSGG